MDIRPEFRIIRPGQPFLYLPGQEMIPENYFPVGQPFLPPVVNHFGFEAADSRKFVLFLAINNPFLRQIVIISHWAYPQGKETKDRKKSPENR
jgi:hypothetical protein